MKQEKITLVEGNAMRGMLVFARPDCTSYTYPKDGWLILIYDIKYESSGMHHINRLASYSLNDGVLYADGCIGGWGYMEGNDFYKPTKEQKKLFIKLLSEKGFKYVKTLNKLIKR